MRVNGERGGREKGGGGGGGSTEQGKGTMRVDRCMGVWVNG